MGVAIPGTPWLIEQLPYGWGDELYEDHMDAPVKEWDPRAKGFDTPFDTSTDENKAYWLGFASGTGINIALLSGLYWGLDVGFAGSVGAGLTQHGTFAAFRSPLGVGAASFVALYYGHQATLGSSGVTLETVDTSGGHGHGGGSSYTAVPSVGIAGWILSLFE
jgi:hypothetical protein